MKKTMIIGLLALVMVFGVACTAPSTESADQNQKLQVVATLFPQYDFTKAIGKDKVEVALLLPPGVEAHSYEPTPQDVVSIQKADVFIYTGENMEPWAHKTLEGVKSENLIVVDGSQGITLLDTHISHEGEMPFEWAGTFELAAGTYTWTFAKTEGQYADAHMLMGVMPIQDGSEATVEAAHEQGAHLFEETPIVLQSGGSVSGDQSLYQLLFNESDDVTAITLNIETAGHYVVLTQHNPVEFEGDAHYLKDASGQDIEALGDEHGSHEEAGHEGHDHGAFDPHIWTDPQNAMIMVDGILAALVQADPENKDFYTENAKSYKDELSQLDAELSEGLKNLKSRTIIYGGHFAFGYFAQRYDLDHVSPYEGFSPDSEPTPQKIAEMIDLMNTMQVKTIFFEELIDPKVARVIADETGATLSLLHGAHNVSKDELKSGVTYITIMKGNLERLKAGLNGE